MKTADNPSVNYDHLLRQAREYASGVDQNQVRLDSKADSLISMHGIHSGVLMSGLIFAVSGNMVPPLVAVAFMPSILCGLGAMVLAAASKKHDASLSRRFRWLRGAFIASTGYFVLLLVPYIVAIVVASKG